MVEEPHSRGKPATADMLNVMPKPRQNKQHIAPAGERALIEHIRMRATPARNSAVRLGIGDDCAIVRPAAGEEVVVTTDFSLEGRHFSRAWHSAASIGHRTLARGLSDIAAMGARPVAAFLSLAMPPFVAKDTRWLDEFFDGLHTLATQHGVSLAGGDTAEAPGDQVLADIVLLGFAPRGRALRRSGARVGDKLYVTGALGGAAAELQQLQQTPRRFAKASADEDHPHLFPQPRIAAGRALLGRGLATACMDLSDGLSTDLAHLCAASGVSAEVNATALPLHSRAEALSPEARLHAVLHGGEDYELLFTAPATTRLPKRLGGVALTCIGRIVQQRKQAVTLLDVEGHATPLVAQGWQHFVSRAEAGK